MKKPDTAKLLRGPIAQVVVASVASYLYIWIFLELTQSRYYYLPFLFFSAMLYVGLDIFIERKLKKSLIPMRERTEKYALPISLGALIGTLLVGLTYEETTFLAIPTALVIGVLMYKAFRVRYARIVKLIGK
jgi:hypothetical protein